MCIAPVDTPSRSLVHPLKMSSWNIRGNLGKPEKGFPPGEFNNRGPFSDGVNAKRIRTNLWPSGKFNDQDGPLSALQNSDGSMRSMSKNLSTNQTVMTLYINIPRLVVPINIPHFSEPHNVSVSKCIGAGDVVFQLRYNDTMLLNGDATNVCTRYMPDLVYCANLATINYLLFGIQTLLAEVYDIFEAPVCDSQQTFEMLWLAKKDAWFASHDMFAKTRFRWYTFLNNISSNDFSNLMRECYYDGFQKCIRPNDTAEQKKTAYLRYMDAFLWDFINTYAKIGGIFIGSDNQGGAHYGQPNPCSYAPTDYVGVLQVAGKNFKVRNMWSACQGGTSSGDILGYKLKFFVGNQPSDPPLHFRLSSNEGTQCDQSAALTPAMRNLGGFSLLVPSKMKRDTVNTRGVRAASGAEERDNCFLQFGICDQVSRPSNIFNSALASACDACAPIVPAPIQMYMRLGFCSLPPQNIMDVSRFQRVPRTSAPSTGQPPPFVGGGPSGGAVPQNPNGSNGSGLSPLPILHIDGDGGDSSGCSGFGGGMDGNNGGEGGGGGIDGGEGGGGGLDGGEGDGGGLYGGLYGGEDGGGGLHGGEGGGGGDDGPSLMPSSTLPDTLDGEASSSTTVTKIRKRKGVAAATVG